MEKFASWALPAPFLSQVIHRAALNHLKTLYHSKQVCRSWRDAAGGDDFNRKLLEECLDITEVKETGCFFDEYEDDWFCYWDESYGVPEDMETNYAFKPLPVGTKAGFVTIPNADILTGGDPLMTLKSITTLLNIGKELDRVEARPGMGSEGDSDLTPIVLPWDSRKELTPVNVLKLMGANRALMQGTGVYQMDFTTKREKIALGLLFSDYLNDLYDEEGDDDDTGNEEDLPDAGRVCKRFREFMFENGQPLVFYAGSELMNPVPVFFLRNLTERLAGGFVAHVIHT